jgi:hypothetical protein
LPGGASHFVSDHPVSGAADDRTDAEGHQPPGHTAALPDRHVFDELVTQALIEQAHEGFGHACRN